MNALKAITLRTLLPCTLTGLLLVGAGPAAAQEQTIHDRMFHSRAVEAVVWAMPLLNFKGFRDGHASVGVGYNDIAYHSKVQDWKFQTATPNNTTPYVNFYWSIKDGPVVVEIPPSADGVGIFGTIMDAWQRPLDGAAVKHALVDRLFPCRRGARSADQQADLDECGGAPCPHAPA